MTPIKPLSPHNQKIMDKIQALTERHNPCNIHPATKDEVGLRYTDYGERFRGAGFNGVKEGQMICNGGTPCCTGCAHLTKRGCTVSAYACRMWFCASAWAKLSFLVQMQIMRLVFLWRQKENQLRFRHDQYAVGKAQAMGHKQPIIGD